MKSLHPGRGIRSLRDALDLLHEQGESLVEVGERLDPHLEIAAHYRDNFATSPANSRTGDEPLVIYKNASGGMPVLMGLFGSRRRNERLLRSAAGGGARRLAEQLADRCPTTWTERPPCQESSSSAKLAALPILTSTRGDAGPYLTSGLVCARDADSGFTSISIHRMRVLDDARLTIWMLPGRDLQRLYSAALERGRSLPISINIGAPPLVYLTSSLTAPFIDPGANELEIAGAVQGCPVEVARCATSDGFCLAQSEIVIEGELLPEVAAEFSNAGTRWAMPEFLGYMGQARAELPVIEVCAVFHRRDAMYQAFLGPGKEQSELLALPTEAGMIAQLNVAMSGYLTVLDAHYLAPSGGQLLLALRVRKEHDRPEGMAMLRDAVVARHALTKAIWVVDEDVDIHSPEDLLWAITTRFQPQRDLYARPPENGFPMDPSQAIGYLDNSRPLTSKYLMDLTAPVAQRQRFMRSSSSVSSIVPPLEGLDA